MDHPPNLIDQIKAGAVSKNVRPWDCGAGALTD